MSSENDPSDSSLLVTSANITNAAVGNYPTNYEIGVLEESISQNYRDEYLGWWSNIEAQSISLSNDLIEQYSGIRDTIASSTSPDVDLGSSRSSDSAADAKYLWIFSGTLSSDSRHQLDLKRELAAFFSNQESDYDIDIEIDGRNYQGNEVVYRPHHQTDQWRIHLPTTSDGFEPHGHDTYVFCDMHLMFEKVPNDGNEYYKLTISDDATQVEEWRVNAEELGDHGFTEPIGNQGEEREYGYY